MDLVNTRFCQEQQTSVRRVPERYRSFVLRLEKTINQISDPRGIRGRSNEEALWIDTRRKDICKELNQINSNPVNSFYDGRDQPGGSYEFSWSRDLDIRFHRSTTDRTLWRTSDGALVRRTGYGLIVTDSYGRMWADNGHFMRLL